MELIVFDLDGTLLDASSAISPYTRETLRQLAERGVLYTVATGRALHTSRDLLEGHGFVLPQAYKNGVLIWDPDAAAYSHHAALTVDEVQHVIAALLSQGVAPFLFTLEPGNEHGIYHGPLTTDVERQLAADYQAYGGAQARPISELPPGAQITHISALGVPAKIDAVQTQIADEPNLVAYAGTAMEGAALRYIDIHHVDGTKGKAVSLLRSRLGIERVVCFGDSDNDLSMFEAADECYAPANANERIKSAATAVIGHHDEEGIARFLRERFTLG